MWSRWRWTLPAPLVAVVACGRDEGVRDTARGRVGDAAAHGVGEARTGPHRLLAALVPQLPPLDDAPVARPSVRSVLAQRLAADDLTAIEVIGMSVRTEDQLRVWMSDVEHATARVPRLIGVLERVARARPPDVILAGYRPDGLDEALAVLLDPRAPVLRRADAAHAVERRGRPEHLPQLATLEKEDTPVVPRPIGVPLDEEATIAALARRCVEAITARHGVRMNENVHVYVHQGTLYLPTPAVSDQNWDVADEPVHVIAYGDTAALAGALARTLGTVPRVISHAEVLKRRLPVVVRAAGARSWREFAGAATSFSVSVLDGRVWCERWRLEDDTFVPGKGTPDDLGAVGAWDAVAGRLMDVVAR